MRNAAANSQRKKKKYARRETVKNRCCCCAFSVRVLDGGFGILEFAAGNYISAGSMLLWMLPPFLPLGFWTRGFLESWNHEAGKYVSAGSLACYCSGSKINLNGSSPTKYIIRMIPVPVPSPVLKKIRFSSSYCFASCSNQCWTVLTFFKNRPFQFFLSLLENHPKVSDFQSPLFKHGSQMDYSHTNLIPVHFLWRFFHPGYRNSCFNN